MKMEFSQQFEYLGRIENITRQMSSLGTHHLIWLLKLGLCVLVINPIHMKGAPFSDAEKCGKGEYFEAAIGRCLSCDTVNKCQPGSALERWCPQSCQDTRRKCPTGYYWEDAVGRCSKCSSTCFQAEGKKCPPICDGWNRIHKNKNISYEQDHTIGKSSINITKPNNSHENLNKQIADDDKRDGLFWDSVPGVIVAVLIVAAVLIVLIVLIVGAVFIIKSKIFHRALRHRGQQLADTRKERGEQRHLINTGQGPHDNAGNELQLDIDPANNPGASQAPGAHDNNENGVNDVGGNANVGNRQGAHQSSQVPPCPTQSTDADEQRHLINTGQGPHDNAGNELQLDIDPANNPGASQAPSAHDNNENAVNDVGGNANVQSSQVPPCPTQTTDAGDSMDIFGSSTHDLNQMRL